MGTGHTLSTFTVPCYINVPLLVIFIFVFGMCNQGTQFQYSSPFTTVPHPFLLQVLQSHVVYQ